MLLVWHKLTFYAKKGRHNMLNIKDLTINIEKRCLIKDLSLSLNKKDKLAIIGEEGNGKSTLLKAILGWCSYAEITGIINYNDHRIGYLEQSIPKDLEEKFVKELLFSSDDDYYNKIADTYRYFEQFKLSDNILEQTINSLSGGEKVKVRIVNLLLSNYDILFLDEPTNDLDLETLDWLEEFINTTTIPIIYVSHDETLLAATANRILHIEQVKHKSTPRHTLASITYDEYVTNRNLAISKQNQIAKSENREFRKKTQALQQIMQKVEHDQNTISRKDPHGAKLLKKKMKTLKSQERKMENTTLTEEVAVEEHINVKFSNISIPSNKIVIDLNIPRLTICDHLLARNITLKVKGGEHICIIGANGVGKSTLIKEIMQNLDNRSDINVGYMPQDYQDVLNPEYVLEYISPSNNKDDITKARIYLGNMNFTHEEMTGKISNLSNGSKAKLILAKLILDNCNVLVLDEPTRNVSPLSNPVIRSIFKGYQGTIISISHDRKYIFEVADKIYELTKDGLILK